MGYDLTLSNWLPPADAVAWSRVRMEFSQTGDPVGIDWTPDAEQAIPIDPTPQTPDSVTLTTTEFPWLEGYVRAVFLHPDNSTSLPSSPIYTMVAWNGGIAGMVPRAGRALQGFTVTLTPTEIQALLADALAEVIWYAPSWGKTLVVTSRDPNNIPLTYEITPELSFPEQTVVISQMALNHFYHVSQGGLISEKIANEAQAWEWAKAASMLADHYKALIKARDDALAIVVNEANQAFDSYVSFLAIRTPEIASLIEPWTDVAGLGGQQLDYRFG
jgi:hypothetical protein